MVLAPRRLSVSGSSGIALICAAIVVALSQPAEGVGEWPPASLPNISVAEERALAPRAFFASFCGPSTCNVFGGVGPSNQATNDLFEAEGFSEVPGQQYFTPFHRSNAPRPPSPRSGAQMVAIINASMTTLVMQGDNVFSILYGGTGSGGEILNDVYFYNFGDERWITVGLPGTESTPPIPLTHFSMTAANRSSDLSQFLTFYVFFGASSINGLSDVVYQMVIDFMGTKVVSFDALTEGVATSDLYRTKPVTPSPSPRVGACCVTSPAYRASMCFGGYDNLDALNDTWLFLHDNNSWLDISQSSGSAVLLSPRLDALCTGDELESTADAAVYLFGGFVSGSLVPVGDANMYTFRFSTMAWSAVGSVDPKAVAPRGGGALLIARNVTAADNSAILQIVGGLSAGGVIGDRWALRLPILPAALANATLTVNLLQSAKMNPDSRSYHSTVAFSDGMVVAFGASGNGQVYDDVYYYHANESAPPSDNWYYVSVSPDAEWGTPEPRFGAASCTRGEKLYFHGGFTSYDKSRLSCELWSLTISLDRLGSVDRSLSGLWQRVDPTDWNSMPCLAFHGMFATAMNIVIVGGMTTSGQSTGNVMVYNLKRHNWIQVAVTPPLSPRAGFSLYFNGTCAFIVSGVNAVGNVQTLYGDLYQLTAPAETSSQTFEANLTKISISRKFFRAYAAVGGSGTTLSICGGITLYTPSLMMGALRSRTCIMIAVNASSSRQLSASFTYFPFDRTTNFRTVVEAGTIGGGGALIGSKFHLFGGMLLEMSVGMEGVASDNLHIMDFSPLLCGAQRGQRNDCLWCSRGSLIGNSTSAMVGGGSDVCVAAPAGGYAVTPWLFVSCPPGQYSQLPRLPSADGCLLCAPGTYNSLPGQTACLPCPTGKSCPLGTVTPLLIDSFANGTSENTTMVQPPLTTTPTTPVMVFGSAGVLAGVLLAVVVGTWWSMRRAKQVKLAAFFDDAALTLVRRVYEDHKRPHFGLDVERLELALRDLGARELPKDLVPRIVAKHDHDGMAHLIFQDFLEALAELIERGAMPPFHDTLFELHRSSGLSSMQRLLSDFSFKKLDGYAMRHPLAAEGQPCRLVKTRTGGITRLMFLVLAVAAATSLTGQFVYTNIEETRGTLPSINFDSSFVTDSIKLEITASGGATKVQDCVADEGTVFENDAGNREGLCATDTAGTGVYPIPAVIASKAQIRCRFRAQQRSCTIALTCTSCALPFDTSFTVPAFFGGEVYATMLDVVTSAASGIESHTSSVSRRLAASPSNLVFRGFPPSQFDFSLLPTLFKRVKSVLLQEPITSTGFHVAANGAAVLGQLVDATVVSEFVGVPVTVTLSTASDALEVARLPKLTALSFFTQMIGSIVGMSSFLIFAMHQVDSRYFAWKYERLQALLEKEAHLKSAKMVRKERQRGSTIVKEGKRIGVEVVTGPVGSVVERLRAKGGANRSAMDAPLLVADRWEGNNVDDGEEVLMDDCGPHGFRLPSVNVPGAVPLGLRAAVIIDEKEI